MPQMVAEPGRRAHRRAALAARAGGPPTADEREPADLPQSVSIRPAAAAPPPGGASARGADTPADDQAEAAAPLGEVREGRIPAREQEIVAVDPNEDHWHLRLHRHQVGPGPARSPGGGSGSPGSSARAGMGPLGTAAPSARGDPGRAQSPSRHLAPDRQGAHPREHPTSGAADPARPGADPRRHPEAGRGSGLGGRGGGGGAPVGDRRGGHRAGAQPGPTATGPDRTAPALPGDLAEPAGLDPPPAKGAAESPAPGPPRRHPTPRDPSAHHQAGHDSWPDRGRGAGRRRQAPPEEVTGGLPTPPWPRSGGSCATGPAGVPIGTGSDGVPLGGLGAGGGRAVPPQLQEGSSLWWHPGHRPGRALGVRRRWEAPPARWPRGDRPGEALARGAP